MRESAIERKTNETKIKLYLALSEGRIEIKSGCGFLDHMLTLFASHAGFSLALDCKGDTFVDYHHTVEDVGICLGKAFAEALGEKKGISRYGFAVIPMDESLVLSSLDISGRTYLGFDVGFPTQKVGDFDTELVEEFWAAFTRASQTTLHFKMFSGRNSHHIAEAVFKSAARAFKQAVSVDPSSPDSLPSTKGIL